MAETRELEVEKTWTIGCSRCANEGQTDGRLTEDEARIEFRLRGWSDVGHGPECPRCSAP